MWTAPTGGLCPHTLQETGGSHPLAAEAEEASRGELHCLRWWVVLLAGMGGAASTGGRCC